MRVLGYRRWGGALGAVLALAAGIASAQNRIAGAIRLAGTGMPDIQVQLSDGDASRQARSGADGAYGFFALPDGEYSITPVAEGYAFTPAKRSIKLQDFSAGGLDFEAAALAPLTPAGMTPPAAPLAQEQEQPPPPQVETLAPASAGIRGRVVVDGAPAAGVMVSYNMVKSPRVSEQLLPATHTDAEGYYRLPRMPGEPRDATLWIEARHPQATMCPAQIFPADAGSFDFQSCEPPRPSATPHRLSGVVMKNGRGVPHVGIHQAFAMRRGADYSHVEFGPAVAYTDDEGRWAFSAPSVSARTHTSGFVSYLSAVQAKGPDFCPPQILLPESMVDAQHLDFGICDPVEENMPPEGTSAIAAAPGVGAYRDPAIAMVGDAPVVAWAQDAADGAVELYVAGWDRTQKRWSAPVLAALAHPQSRSSQPAFAANARLLALAYEDYDSELGTHVVLTLSTDGGRTWQAQKLGNFVDHSSTPSLALGAMGDVHLAYWYAGSENLRRIVYQRKRPGGEFRAVSLPLTNTLGQDSGLWALPALALALDESGVSGVAYFLGGPDDYLQLAFWKPGMPTAAKIAEAHAAAAAPAVDLALYAGNASVFYRFGAADAQPWGAEGDYGERWAAPVKLEAGGGARGDGALNVVINGEGDRVFGAGSASGGSWWLVHGANLKLLLMVDEKNASLGQNTRGLGLVLDGERRVNAVYVGGDGALTLYRKLLP